MHNTSNTSHHQNQQLSQSIYNIQNNERQLLHHSQQLKQSPTHYNVRQIIINQLSKQQYLKKQQQRRLIFTRESLSALHKKQKNMRKTNYLLAQTKSARDKQIENNNILIAKQASFIRVSSATIRPLSSASSHQFRPIQGKDEKRVKTTHTRRPTSTQRIFKMESQIKIKKQLQFRRQNPMVIYPFETHLKTKRIDDNPKVLSTIISKKYKVMEKKDLYQYVNKLMMRTK